MRKDDENEIKTSNSLTMWKVITDKKGNIGSYKVDER